MDTDRGHAERKQYSIIKTITIESISWIHKEDMGIIISSMENWNDSTKYYC